LHIYLGKRFISLTHVGCKSEKVHHTVLANLRFDMQTHEIFAIDG
jgi:hypothetical protein